MNLFKLFQDIEAVDGDATERLGYYSRRSLLRLGSKALTVSAPAVMASVLNEAYAQSSSVQDVLNYALTLEYLEDDYYQKGNAAANLIPAADKAIFTQIGKHETAHVALLRGALGSAAVAKPAFKYPAATFTDYQTFLLLAQAFEDTGVRAYKGQAGNLLGMDVLTTALQIHSVEARHASEVRRLRGLRGWVSATDEAPAPVYAGEAVTSQAGVDLVALTGKSADRVREAFDEPLDRAAVLAIAQPYL
ncbi:ferritin-like domain-containing protein [Rudanella lutea]|jgi:rubrerythrin|uniref:ferritin-like domain-containing protein n=1 Tax=Rudanella lutea TaxID=451374 RepID=UPI000367CCE8|nr:ferritin-like domain-containing protein [Rudanella lutea]